ncbi:NAD(+) ADP-ribosyltransferase [Handroanthus impetiginosus]|uniref:Poly [ADP-ribose] polymerase n=1 Tax=Handroanthus impetiginosus TaxID=429701 RepID=A0A2G9GRK1_9LAMI|nr:NAD(+) ADP-ribosyltransferase [Handroanthus impetiginosus]
MESNSIENCSEKLNSSAHKNSTKLSLFEDLDSCPSDCESGVSGGENEQFPLFDIGLIRIQEKEMIYKTIETKLVSSLSSYVNNLQVQAIHRSDYSNLMNRAKFQSFCIYSKALEIKNGGNANVKYAWFGASKNEIDRIIRHGFGFPTNNPTQGHGVYLSPADHPIGSMRSAEPDENGLRHMLLCRVILGNAEVISPGSTQYNPSSEEFDSGVDNPASPQKYIVWTSRMNTHILPDFVVSFRASSY